MAEKLASVPDPEDFDAQVYIDLPLDRTVVVEGKLATRVGPKYIDAERPIHLVDLTVHPFQSAVRVMQREGTPYESIFEGSARTFMSYHRDVSSRARHIEELRRAPVAQAEEFGRFGNVQSHAFDTSSISSEEIVDQLFSPESGSSSKQHELMGINEFAARLSAFAIRLNGYNQHPIDKEHFDYNFKNMLYQMQRFRINHNEQANSKLRDLIRSNAIDSAFSLFMRSVPRFYEEGEGGGLKLDTSSTKWTPEFYKVAMAMPTLNTLLQDKKILDPFGGAGSLMFYLAAKEIPESIVCSDICYPGGVYVGEEEAWYSPISNQQSIMSLFSSLPSWARPDFSRIKGFVTSDVMRLPLPDDAVDVVVGDPPYGINCAQGNAQVLALALPELMRVSKEGMLTMLPEAWVPTLQKSSYQVEKITADLSQGASNLPTCYVFIRPGASRR